MKTNKLIAISAFLLFHSFANAQLASQRIPSGTFNLKTADKVALLSGKKRLVKRASVLQKQEA